MAERDSRTYESYKWTTFACMYVGYVMAMLSRKSFSFALPSIIHEENFDKDDLGLITSSQNLAYAISKFVGGVLADHVSAKVLFSTGICASGFLTFALTAFDSSSVYAFIWFLNGLCQGGCWPACAKILKQWAKASEFGTLWGVLSTSMNVACSIGPLVSAAVTAQYGWRASLQIFGCLTAMTTIVCLVFMIDSPRDVGFKVATQKGPCVSGQEGGGRGRGGWPDLLRSRLLWLLAAGFFVVFMVRTATLDWAQLYLVQQLGHSRYTGSIFISSLETGGICGSVAAGYLADKLVTSHKGDDTRGSPRITVCILFLSLCLLGQHALAFTMTSHSSQAWIVGVGMLLGVGIYGPCTLYGAMAFEAAPAHLASTSHALVALAANCGAVMAGLPFSWIATWLNWWGAFIVLQILTAGILVLTITSRNLEYKVVPTRKKLE